MTQPGFGRNAFDDYLDQVVKTPLTMSAAEETAAGLLGRALATAEVGGEFGHLFTRQILNSIGREMVLNGESLWKYEGGNLKWLYNDPNPGGATLNMMRFAIMIDWQTGRGVSALDCARRWKQIVRQLERGIDLESRATPYYLTPVPLNQDQATGLRASIKKLLNRIPTRTEDRTDEDDDKTLEGATDTFVEGEMSTGISGYNPTGNYKQNRLGTDVPPHVANLLAMAIDIALAAIGVPKALYNPADSNSMREAWRIYLSTTVESTSKIIEDEAARIGLDMKLSFPELKSSDIAARARSFKDLVLGGSGLTLEQAVAVSGILREVEDADES